MSKLVQEREIIAERVCGPLDVLCTRKSILKDRLPFRAVLGDHFEWDQTNLKPHGPPAYE